MWSPCCNRPRSKAVSSPWRLTTPPLMMIGQLKNPPHPRRPRQPPRASCFYGVAHITSIFRFPVAPSPILLYNRIASSASPSAIDKEKCNTKRGVLAQQLIKHWELYDKIPPYGRHLFRFSPSPRRSWRQPGSLSPVWTCPRPWWCASSTRSSRASIPWTAPCPSLPGRQQDPIRLHQPPGQTGIRGPSFPLKTKGERKHEPKNPVHPRRHRRTPSHRHAAQREALLHLLPDLPRVHERLLPAGGLCGKHHLWHSSRPRQPGDLRGRRIPGGRRLHADPAHLHPR